MIFVNYNPIQMADLATLVVSAYRRNDYKFFHRGQFNLNMFGIRSADRDLDSWDDVLGCLYRDSEDKVCLHLWKGTTDPGLAYTTEPINSRGVAIMAKGQYANLWRVGLHKKRHPAFVQNAPVIVHRDNNRDEKLDFTEDYQTGHFGINGHQAYRSGLSKVGVASAGCQVWHSTHAMKEALALAARQQDVGLGNTITYTLFDAEDDPQLQQVIEALPSGV